MLVFIRHAELDCTRDGIRLLCGSHDAPLSAAGVLQVERLRRRLIAEPPVQAVYASPLVRAVETARACPPGLISSMRLLKSLAEIDCGVFEGVSLERLKVEHPDIWARNETQTDENFRWPGGETYRRFRRRVLRAIRAVAARHAGERVLMFTHAGVVNQVLGALAGQSAARWENFRPAYASLTVVHWQGSSGQVERFSDTEHLR
jgi:broad specificity phosphatase PhoE